MKLADLKHRMNKGSVVEPEDWSQKDIAIIGLSFQLAEGVTELSQYWNKLKEGHDFVGELSGIRKQDIYNYLAFLEKKMQLTRVESAFVEEIDKFDYSYFRLSPKEASLMDPNQRMFLETAWSAIEDAGYGGGKINGSRTGVYLGAGANEDYKRMIERVAPEELGTAFAGNIPSVIASRISYLLDLRGPSMLIDTACSASLVALHTACQAIRAGECEAALVGGINMAILPPEHEITVGVESSSGRTHTFDAASDGTGRGEGVIAVMIKPYRVR